MKFNWIDFRQLVDELNSNSKSIYQEAIQRTIVSRSYYAAFCYAREIALEKKYATYFSDTVNAHREVRHAYKDVDPEISDSLEDLRDLRNTCDYTNEVKNINQIVKDSIKMADKIIDTTMRLPPKP